MADQQTIYEIRQACGKPGCPVCTLVQRAGARYIEGIYGECILDPDVRQKLADSLGFCYGHTWLAIDLKLTEALGHAILFQSLVNRAGKILADGEKAPGQQLAAALEPELGCPACRIEAETTERVTDSLAHALKDQDFVNAYQASNGLCLPHLKLLLPKLDQKRQSSLLTHQRARMESLKNELGEFIRKNDFRFREERIGAEGDSYKRAADLLAGKRRPAERKDLK
ncbi:MAG TPA: DUF6062 family protein [Anaerolineales bacterium]|nr:DUF6062 family protein [Anaerolineales bacterium]